MAVTLAAALTACGRLDNQRHAFPADVGRTPSASASEPSTSPTDATRTPAPTGTGTRKPTAAPDPTGSLSTSDLDALSGEELLRRAKTAAKTVKTVHYVFEITRSGQRSKLSFDVDRDAGTFDGTVESDGAVVALRKVGAEIWMKGDRDFWRNSARVPSDVAAKAAGKYVLVPEDNPGYERLAAVAVYGDLGGVLSMFTPKGHGATTTLDGNRVVAVQCESGVAAKREQDTVYLRADGPLLLTRVDAADLGYFAYSAFNTPFHITAPPAAQVVDLAELGATKIPLPGV
ncbi:hypothetical protein [Yinghuangia seranimata]|uniref:hypothetical protein n=1 Tax=Yinghuangia seranimata TaxID=408067 RepID=UPI00248D23C5|nr:hypothetical protein [Yinghuangia seranimata]MDI2125298.1 hypothetical protein [Yinghuangia seranimata]